MTSELPLLEAYQQDRGGLSRPATTGQAPPRRFSRPFSRHTQQHAPHDQVFAGPIFDRRVQQQQRRQQQRCGTSSEIALVVVESRCVSCREHSCPATATNPTQFGFLTDFPIICMFSEIMYDPRHYSKIKINHLKPVMRSLVEPPPP